MVCLLSSLWQFQAATCQGMVAVSANQVGRKWMCVLVPKEKSISTAAKHDTLGLPFDSKNMKHSTTFWNHLLICGCSSHIHCAFFLHTPKWREIWTSSIQRSLNNACYYQIALASTLLFVENMWFNHKTNNIPPRVPIRQKGSTVVNNLFCKIEVSRWGASKLCLLNIS